MFYLATRVYCVCLPFELRSLEEVEPANDEAQSSEDRPICGYLYRYEGGLTSRSYHDLQKASRTKSRLCMTVLCEYCAEIGALRIITRATIGGRSTRGSLLFQAVVSLATYV